MAHLTATSSIVNGPSTLSVSTGTSFPMNNSVLNAATFVDSAGSILSTNSDLPCVMNTRGLIENVGVCTMSGSITTQGGSILRVLANASTNSQLTSASGFTNGASIELTSTGAATAATLTVTSGALINSPAGSISSLVGAGGARTLASLLDNQGLVDVKQSLTITKAGLAHMNSGTLAVAATKTVTIVGSSFTNSQTGVLTGSGAITFSAGTSFAQNGFIRPGTPIGRLTLNGPLPCSSTSNLDVAIAGDSVVTGYDQAAIRDAATLAGTLNISVTNGYKPVPGRRYVIATFASRAGTFSNVTGLNYGAGELWTVAYSDTDVVLLALDQKWARILPDGGLPSARDGHTAVLDSTSDRMIVFGGKSDAGALNDVWVLTHATGGNYPAWIALAPTGTPPAPRTNATAVYDPASNRMIVHGGDDGAASPTPFGDTWVLTNANGTGGTPAWIALTPGGAPAARTAHAAAYDALSNRMMLVGGDTTPATCGGVSSAVYVLSNANGLGGAPVWTPLSPLGTPPTGRAHHGAAYDAATGRLIVTGGDSCGVANTDTYLLDGANGLGGTPAWSALSPAPTGAPAGWSLGRFAYDASLGWIDGFGGKVGTTLVDTSFTLTAANGNGTAFWERRLFYGTRPAPRTFHSMVLRGGSHVAVVFGGSTAAGRTNDLWRRDLYQAPVLAVDPPVGPVHVSRTAFSLPPSPNPAIGAVAMAIDVGHDQAVDLSVFDLFGRRVATLHSGVLAAGRHRFTWDGGSSAGHTAPGVYLVRMSAQDRTQVARVVRLER
jgi:hypothetical protein